jgi:hypothetical protein
MGSRLKMGGRLGHDGDGGEARGIAPGTRLLVDGGGEAEGELPSPPAMHTHTHLERCTLGSHAVAVLVKGSHLDILHVVAEDGSLQPHGRPTNAIVVRDRRKLGEADEGDLGARGALLAYPLHHAEEHREKRPCMNRATDTA